ncbi:MAG: lysophospholipid acyltransferase family protein [Desulfurivibrionaceae bacterium]
MKLGKTLVRDNDILQYIKDGFRKLFFNIYFWPLFVLITLISFFCIPLITAANFFFHFWAQDKAFRNGIRIYGQVIIKIASVMAPVEVEDRSGGLSLPAIFVANHNSSADPFLFGALPFENSFVTSWPFRIPFYRWAMKQAGYIDANKGWENLVREGCRLFNRGSSLIIWPEGHRSPEAELQRFRSGAFRLALETGRPIVPVCILGSGDLLPPGRRLLNPVPVKLIIYPEIPPERYANASQAHKMLGEEVRDIIQKEIRGAGEL